MLLMNNKIIVKRVQRCELKLMIALNYHYFYVVLEGFKT